MLAYSIIFSIIKAYSHILRHIQAYSVIFSTLCNPHIFATLPLFWALAYLAFKTNLKAYSRGLFKTETLTKDIQKALFSHIQAFPEPWATLAYAETWHTQNPRIFRTLQLHPRVCSEPCHIYKNLWIFRTLTYFKTWHIHKPLKDLRWSFLKKKKKKKSNMPVSQQVLIRYLQSDFALCIVRYIFRSLSIIENSDIRTCSGPIKTYSAILWHI